MVQLYSHGLCRYLHNISSEFPSVVKKNIKTHTYSILSSFGTCPASMVGGKKMTQATLDALLHRALKKTNNGRSQNVTKRAVTSTRSLSNSLPIFQPNLTSYHRYIEIITSDSYKYGITLSTETVQSEMYASDERQFDNVSILHNHTYIKSLSKICMCNRIIISLKLLQTHIRTYEKTNRTWMKYVSSESSLCAFGVQPPVLVILEDSIDSTTMNDITMKYHIKPIKLHVGHLLYDRVSIKTVSSEKYVSVDPKNIALSGQKSLYFRRIYVLHVLAQMVCSILSHEQNTVRLIVPERLRRFFDVKTTPLCMLRAMDTVTLEFV